MLAAFPEECGEAEVASFLEHLALKRKVFSATRAQALNAPVFDFAKATVTGMRCSLHRGGREP